MNIPSSPYIWLALVLASLGGLFGIAKKFCMSLRKIFVNITEEEVLQINWGLSFFFVGFLGSFISYMLVLAWSLVDTTSMVERSSNLAVVLLTHFPFLCGAFFFLGQGIYGICSGTFITYGGTPQRKGVLIIKREESPLKFWLFCLSFAGFGGFVLINAFRWKLNWL